MSVYYNVISRHDIKKTNSNIYKAEPNTKKQDCISIVRDRREGRQEKRERGGKERNKEGEGRKEREELSACILINFQSSC